MTDVLYILKNPSSVETLDKYDYPNIGYERMEELVKLMKSKLES
ncbi:hypothetical protein ES703_75313 [subsurface metagenome]